MLVKFANHLRSLYTDPHICVLQVCAHNPQSYVQEQAHMHICLYMMACFFL